MEKLMAAIGVFFLAILIALIFGFLLAWVIMVLWNCLMPDIFQLATDKLLASSWVIHPILFLNKVGPKFKVNKKETQNEISRNKKLY